MIYELSRFLSFVILKILFKLEIKGKEIFPQNQPFVIASNHVSHLDPVVIGVGCPEALYYLAKEELFRNTLFGLLLKNLNVIPLKRSATDFRALRLALAILKQKPLVIFPQGTRADSYDNFKSGVGFLYKKTSAVIIAAKVYGTDMVLSINAKFLRRGKIKVVFDRVTGVKDTDSYEEIAAKVIAKIKTL